MEVGERAGRVVAVEVVDQPLVLRRRGRPLVVLIRGVEGDEVPAAGVVAVVVGHVVPVLEVAGRGAVLVLVVANGWVRHVTEEAVVDVGLAVPVVELGIGALVVDVAQVEEDVGVPTVDHLCHQLGVAFAAGAVADGGHDQRLPGGTRPRCDRHKCGARRGCTGIGEVEPHEGRRTLEAVAHDGIHRECVRAVGNRVTGQLVAVGRLEVGEQIAAVKREEQLADARAGTGNDGCGGNSLQAADNGAVGGLREADGDRIGVAAGRVVTGRAAAGLGLRRADCDERRHEGEEHNNEQTPAEAGKAMIHQHERYPRVKATDGHDAVWAARSRR